MTAQSKPYPVVDYLINKFADWLNHRRELSEIRQTGPYRFRPDRRRFADFAR